MDVSVLYDGKRYKFCDVDGSKKWIDNKNIVVPLILGQKLRKLALSEGFDQEVFNNKKKTKKLVREEEVKKAKVKSKSRKGSVTGGLNLASLMKNIGDKNE